MVDGALLHRVITQYESLDMDRQEVVASQAECIEAAVDAGFDKALLKKFIRELRKDPQVVKAELDALDEYRAAWLEFNSTPLGAYAQSQSEPMDGASQLQRQRDTDRAAMAEANERDAKLDLNDYPDDPKGMPKRRRRGLVVVDSEEPQRPDPMFDA